MKFVIMLAFGHPKGDPLRHDLKGFRRKSLEQIADKADPKLEPAGLAPSNINRQPWYFTHEGKTIHVYCVKKDTIGYMNRIDMGIALAHLYVKMQKLPGFVCLRIHLRCRDMATSKVSTFMLNSAILQEKDGAESIIFTCG